MAHYDITYRCGHKDTVQIYGTSTHGEREKKAAWYGTIDCPDCKAAKTRQANKAAGMAELEGSDKQIGWAEDIRAQDMAEYARQRQDMVDHGSTDEQLADADQLIAWLKHKTSAQWWIDHKRSPLEALYAAQQAIDDDRDPDMAELEGSDKQIAWAKDIRSECMAEYTLRRQEIACHWADADQLIAWLKHKTSARWWIIHNGSPLEALRAAEKALAGKKALETAVKEPEAK